MPTDVWVILPRENIVIRNGVVHDVDTSALDQMMEQIEWHPDRNAGTIQYDNAGRFGDDFRHNSRFTSISSWQYLLDAWQVADDLANLPPPPGLTVAEVAFIAEQSQRAVMKRRANDLARDGKLWEATQLLLKAHGLN